MKSILLVACVLLSAWCKAQQNIIFIMSDDHDADAISAYNSKLVATPNIDRLAKEGMRFTRAFVGNSICSPARATLLTGQHSHMNGVKDNRTRFDSSRMTMPKLLQAAGYQTALVGKWHLHSYPTGFDYWKILPGQGLYVNPRMINMSGDTLTYLGYSTDVITDEAITWLQQRDKSKPFVLFLQHKAPHRYFFPKLKYLEAYHTRKIPEPSTLYADTVGKGTAWNKQTMSILHDMTLCSDLKIDPAFLAGLPEYHVPKEEVDYYNAIMNRVPEQERKRYKEIYAERGRILQLERPTGKALLQYKYQWYMQDFLACVASIDEGVGRVLDYLDQEKLASSTAVMYTSDQGFYLGENGWFDKRFAYDVSMQTPLLVRWPGKIKPGSVSQTMVQNIDFAPTLLQVANQPVPAWMQGVSLVPVFKNASQSLNRDCLYYHYYEYVKDHTVIPHVAVRGNRYKLIYFYTVGEWEFYDLDKDAFEQNNLINSPQYKREIALMKDKLAELRKAYSDNEPLEAGQSF